MSDITLQQSRDGRWCCTIRLNDEEKLSIGSKNRRAALRTALQMATKKGWKWRRMTDESVHQSVFNVHCENSTSLVTALNAAEELVMHPVNVEDRLFVLYVDGFMSADEAQLRLESCIPVHVEDVEFQVELQDLLGSDGDSVMIKSITWECDDLGRSYYVTGSRSYLITLSIHIEGLSFKWNMEGYDRAAIAEELREQAIAALTEVHLTFAVDQMRRHEITF